MKIAPGSLPATAETAEGSLHGENSVSLGVFDVELGKTGMPLLLDRSHQHSLRKNLHLLQTTGPTAIVATQRTHNAQTFSTYAQSILTEKKHAIDLDQKLIASRLHQKSINNAARQIIE